MVKGNLIITVFLSLAPPGPPTNVRALIMSPSELKLQWDGPKTPTPLFYIIYWGEDPDNLKRVWKDIIFRIYISH